MLVGTKDGVGGRSTPFRLHTIYRLRNIVQSFPPTPVPLPPLTERRRPYQRINIRKREGLEVERKTQSNTDRDGQTVKRRKKFF